MNEGKRILVIEDDPILRDLLAEWLLAAGYRVGVAAEGASGIADARAHPPGGATVIAEVRRMYPEIPVIAISAHFRSDLGLAPEDALALGAARTLAKPFKRKEMVGAVLELAGPPAA
jgi:CheY-like chemotaxis protein